MRKNRTGCILLLLALFSLSGCNDQRILEDLGFTYTATYDLKSKEKGKVKEMDIGLSIPIAHPEKKRDREVLKIAAESSKEARVKLSSRTSRTLVSGQLRNVLFSEELARYGIWENIDTLVRDPSISQVVHVIIVNGNAFELMRKDYPEHLRTGQYISKLIEKEANTQAIPKVTLYHFTREYFDDGIDPVVPVMRQEGDNLILDGIGLFQDDRYITKIQPDKGVLFSVLKRKFKEGQIKINIQKEDGENKEIALLSSVHSSRRYTVKEKPDGNFKVTINIDIRGSILEYIGDKNLSEEKDRRQMEKQMADFIEKETYKIVQLTQENNVDSLGVGKYVRNSLSQKEWGKLDWREVYPNVEIDIKAKVKIRDYGKFK